MMGNKSYRSTIGGPICVFCGKGTTQQRLVGPYVRLSSRRRFYAHVGCAERNKHVPIPQRQQRFRAPTLAESLAAWNAMVDELERLFVQVSAGPYSEDVAKAARDAWNANSYKKIDMTWALADPRADQPFEADDHCRKLGWHIERLKRAIERDGPRPLKRRVVRLSVAKLRLPDTVDEIREQYRGRGRQQIDYANKKQGGAQ
jgi:hypothetical protein